MSTEEFVEKFKFTHPGFCPVCEQSVVFSADGPFFSKHFALPGLPHGTQASRANGNTPPIFPELAGIADT